MSDALSTVGLWLVAIALFCPGPLALAWLLRQTLLGVRYASGRNRTLGLVFLGLSTLMSPGLPAYIASGSVDCGGGGCVNGLVLLFLLPFIWAFFGLGSLLLAKAKIQA